MEEFFTRLQDKPIEVVAVFFFALIALGVLAVMYKALDVAQYLLKEGNKYQEKIADRLDKTVELDEKLLDQRKADTDNAGRFFTEATAAILNLSDLSSRIRQDIDGVKKNISDGFKETGDILQRTAEQSKTREMDILSSLDQLKTYFEQEITKVHLDFEQVIRASRANPSREDFEQIMEGYMSRLHLTENTFNRLLALADMQAQNVDLSNVDTVILENPKGRNHNENSYAPAGHGTHDLVTPDDDPSPSPD